MTTAASDLVKPRFGGRSPALGAVERQEGIAAVFRTVGLAVGAATLAAVILAGVLVSGGLASPRVAALFVAFIAGCAGAHVVLRQAYFAATAPDRPIWAHVFTLFCLVEGFGWGWTPVGLVSGQNFAAELLCLLVTLGLASGAIAAFGPYLPAFLAFFLPATIPYFLQAAASAEPLRQGSAILMALYITAVGAFGFAMNRLVRHFVGLRLEAERLALDLSRQVEIAEAANRSKSSFLAAASHDLRQPVHALGLFVGALREMPMSSEAIRILEQIDASSQAMDALFAALLDISRLDAGIVDVNREPFAIDPLLRRICREHAEDAIAKDIGLARHRSSAIVESDQVLVERILRNLVSNAIRYTSRGRVVVGCRRRGAHLRIEVWDTGQGIAANQQERIFQEYYQIGNEERDRAKGLGLGLAIVRRLTRLIGCELTLTSRVGRGTCFALSLPLAKRVAAAPSEEVPVAQPLPLRGGMIVVVDDEASIRTAMIGVLTRWGHQVIAAASGADAIAQLAGHPKRPDLIISDFRLRRSETGIEVIQALQLEYNAKIPAILITGDTATERLAEAHASGFLLLHKPVSNGRLRAAIVNTLAGTPVG